VKSNQTVEKVQDREISNTLGQDFNGSLILQALSECQRFPYLVLPPVLDFSIYLTDISLIQEFLFHIKMENYANN